MSTRPEILDHAAVLSEMTRCRILQILERQELRVAELATVLQLPQSTVSRHLKVLADGGWVRSSRDGTSHLYRLAGGALEDPAKSLWALVRDQLADVAVVAQDRRRLETVLRERRSRSQQFFSETADGWDHLRDELFGHRFDLEALPALLDRRWVIGDLGCGTGRTAETLAPHVASVYAVDGSAAMLDAARARLRRFDNVRFREGELEKLPIEDATLDAAILSLVLHYAPHPRRILTEVRRALKPDGRVLVVDMTPHDHEDYRQRMGHVWLGFAAEQITASLEAAGFDHCRVRPLPVVADVRGPSLFVASAVAGEPVANEIEAPAEPAEAVLA